MTFPLFNFFTLNMFRFWVTYWIIKIALPLDAFFLNDLVNRTAAVNVLRVNKHGCVSF